MYDDEEPPDFWWCMAVLLFLCLIAFVFDRLV